MGGSLLAIVDVDALVKNAQHNSRFAWVRVPIVVVVASFVWTLCGPMPGFVWTAAILGVEFIAASMRARLIGGATAFATWHLMSLGMMSLLWVAFALLLWPTSGELGRTAAIIGLLTTALYGALSGAKDWRPAAILALPPLVALVALVSSHAWLTWSWPIALMSMLGTFGASVSVLLCAWALNRSDQTLEKANADLAWAAEDRAKQAVLLDETSAAAQVGGWRFDLRTRKLEWTPQTRRLLGVDETFEPTLANVVAFHAPHSRPVIKAAVRRAMTTGEGWELELELDTARGERRWFRSNGKATVVDGRPITLIGAVLDITDRVSLEDELRQAQKLESIGRLTGGIAHDFNNILTAILNSAESLERSTEPRTLQIAQLIGRAAERGCDLTDNLLAFSRKQALSPQVLDVNAALREAKDLITPLLKGTISLDYDLHVGPLFAVLDRGQFISAVLNLAINACDAMPEGGCLRIISALEPSGQVAILVVDTGEGMTETLREKIFDPFFTTKPVGMGTGLGLSMVHGFVSQSGGAINVVSAPGKGTSIRMTFALSEAPLFDEAPVTPSLSAGDPARRLLVVDDDPLVRDALSMALRSRGYHVEVASSAAEAFQIFAPERFDVAIVDVVLTRDMAGPALVTKLIAQDPSLRAILASGYTYDKKLPVVDGRVSFLAKPFSVDTLVTRLGGPTDLNHVSASSEQLRPRQLGT